MSFHFLPVVLRSPERSTEGTAGGKLEYLLLGDWPVSLDVVEIDANVGNELVISDGKVLDTTLGALYGLSLGIYYGTIPRSLKCSTEGIAEGSFEGFFISAWLVSLNVLELGKDDSNVLWLWYGKPLGTTIGALDGISLVTYDDTVLRSLEGST